MTGDTVLFVLSVISTVALAAIGIAMPSNPPTKQMAKCVYTGVFAFFGLLLLVSSTWGFVRNSTAQNRKDIEMGSMGQKLSDIDATVNKVADSSNCPEIRQL